MKIPTTENEDDGESSPPKSIRLRSLLKNKVSRKLANHGKNLVNEVKVECLDILEVREIFDYVISKWPEYIHVPYFPCISKPGWLLRFIIGPHDYNLFEVFYSDIFAGITVAMTLIPQALSYAKIANLPPINGLYTSILPIFAYAIFGSSMHLGIGPVAIISLLTGQLVVQYGLNDDPVGAVNFAGEAALAVGVIFTAMSVINLGDLIFLISHSVMSGFTTAAACLIGLSQLKSAFGFSNKVPQSGQPGYEYNYQVMQWFAEHWNDVYPSGRSVRNHYATSISLALVFPLLLVQIIRNHYRPTPERKKNIYYNIWMILSSLLPFAAIIIGAHVAYVIKMNGDDLHTKLNHERPQYYANELKIVGTVPSGLSFLRSPKMNWDFAKLIGDVLPLTLIAYMESYSVAQRIATQKNELHFLHASQELFANGVANLLASVSSGYPVAGSFSRSSLNSACGSRTPMSTIITAVIIILSLSFFTGAFQFIPYAALAAIIWSSIFNLIIVSEFWHAWVHSKKDFFVMITTFAVVFIFNTAVGLACGIAVSVFVILCEALFSNVHVPIVARGVRASLPREVVEQKQDDECAVLFSGTIDLITLRTDLNFITVRRLNDQFTSLILTKETAPDLVTCTPNDRLFFTITTSLDRLLTPKILEGVETLPKAIVIDFKLVRIIDLTAMLRLEEMTRNARAKKVKVVFFNVSDAVAASFNKFGLRNDRSSRDLNLDEFLAQAGNMQQLKERTVGDADTNESVELLSLIKSEGSSSVLDSSQNDELMLADIDANDYEDDDDDVRVQSSTMEHRSYHAV